MEALRNCSFFKEGKYFNQTHCLTKIKTLEFKEIKQIFLDPFVRILLNSLVVCSKRKLTNVKVEYE